MAFADYSTTAASNTSIAGISIAEDCPAANINNAIRQLMADARSEHDSAASTAGLMPQAGGTFSGTQPIYTGRGAYMHHNNSANTSGRWFIQADGGATPTMANGDWLATY